MLHKALIGAGRLSRPILPVPPASGHGQIRDSVEVLAGGPNALARVVILYRFVYKRGRIISSAC